MIELRITVKDFDELKNISGYLSRYTPIDSFCEANDDMALPAPVKPHKDPVARVVPEAVKKQPGRTVYPDRICQACGHSFTPKRHDQKVCNLNCRQKYNNSTQRDRKPKAKEEPKPDHPPPANYAGIPFVSKEKMTLTEAMDTTLDQHMKERAAAVEMVHARDECKRPVQIDRRTTILVDANISDEEAIAKYRERHPE